MTSARDAAFTRLYTRKHRLKPSRIVLTLEGNCSREVTLNCCPNAACGSRRSKSAFRLFPDSQSWRPLLSGQGNSMGSDDDRKHGNEEFLARRLTLLPGEAR